MRHILPPHRVKQIYESKIRKLAYARWEKACKPEGRELEFWFLAEAEQRDKDIRFGGLTANALPNYGV